MVPRFLDESMRSTWTTTQSHLEVTNPKSKPKFAPHILLGLLSRVVMVYSLTIPIHGGQFACLVGIVLF